MKSKLPVIMLSVVVLITATVWLTREKPSSRSDAAHGAQRLFPGLEQALNDITRIRVEHHGLVYDVTKKGDHWQLPGKGGYPVLFERVKPLLLGMALLEKVEPKTDRPKNYVRLGVEEPSVHTANTRIALYATADKPVASLIVGMIQAGLIAGGRDGIYARVSGQQRSWLLAGHLVLPQRPVDWVDRQFIHIKPKRVKRVTIIQPDGSRLVVEKSRQGAANYHVMNLPEGAALKQGVQVNPLARGLSALKMDDVFVHKAIQLPESTAVNAIYETWDGLRITAHTVEQDRKMLLWFDLADASGDNASVISDLHARLDGRVYQIPYPRAERLRKRLGDLVTHPVGQ